ncbi:integral membrane protein [Rutstroemia sp. NJR-2017a WRK4]|nr:integral membrane protein [Rutstroemia sp. NJR-2017a WRK4]
MSAKIEWIVQLLGILQIGLVKLSFVFFFRRVFATLKFSVFTKFNTALIVLVIIWTTGYFFTFLFACKGHFSQWWEGIRTGRPICLSDVVFSEGLAISDFIIDLFIISMPIPMIVLWTLIECSLGLIAACLPLLYGLVRSSTIESVVRSVRSTVSLASFGSHNSRSNTSRIPGTASSYAATVLADKSKNESSTSHTPIIPEASGSIVSV